ncbi:energy-coupled thiamine transporter ThiT [Spiroplasma sp. DGKH1]|uniref:energy-coupled thiamine transporter ThiT n=1 Tax=Spiroplasma sp. DGKH1 TaxID=3050074 RepID=UPI0034C5E264
MEQTVENFYDAKKQKIILWTGKIICIIPIVLYLVFLILTASLNATLLSNLLHINNDENLQNMRLFLICFCSFGLIFAILYAVSCWICKYEEYLNYKMQFILLSIFSLNILNLVLNITIYSQELKPQDTIFKDKTKQKKFWQLFGIRKWYTFDYVIIALFVGITLALNYIESYLLPQLPNGGGVALKYIPLIILAFIHSSLAGWICGAVSSLLAILFIQSGFIISPWSFILDYFLPMTTPCLAGWMRFKVTNDKKYITYINYLIMCITIMLIIYFWQILSAVAVWNVLYPDAIWKGYAGWLYAFVYNFIHMFLFTYPLTQIVVPIALRGLAPVYINRFQQHYGY